MLLCGICGPPSPPESGKLVFLGLRLSSSDTFHPRYTGTQLPGPYWLFVVTCLGDNLTPAYPTRGKFRGWLYPRLRSWHWQQVPELVSLHALTTDFRVLLGHVAGASPAAGFHPCFWGSRIFWLQSKVGIWLAAMEPSEIRFSVGICLPLLVSVSSLRLGTTPVSLSTTRVGSHTTGMGLSPMPLLHNLQSLVPIVHPSPDPTDQCSGDWRPLPGYRSP